MRVEPPTPRSRPYRLSIDGGHVLGTFHHAEHARERARTLVDLGLVPRCWLRHRDEDEFEMIGKLKRMARPADRGP